ncbi:hypothetical protein pb186bvf_002490 [Paramecium bursaria]
MRNNKSSQNVMNNPSPQGQTPLKSNLINYEHNVKLKVYAQINGIYKCSMQSLFQNIDVKTQINAFMNTGLQKLS